ncbi:Uncharacterised protein [Actinomyces bovis]|uniref:Uncharacterized protein n=1 Tax=Actinomyces bovis TaxID=1658 RepID=A0ABY1VLL9_9ACTO|nr:hypothetical protein [Actinomyces bovis]SPT52809.1 Uncharacterised protein [Actinomyces bovis]VEG54856.1 Uncharacterised protein [Actinomyces israelii]
MNTTPASPSALTPEDTSSLSTSPLPQTPDKSATTADPPSPFSAFADPTTVDEKNPKASPAASVSDGVWSANRPTQLAPVPVSTTMRSGTVTWGVFLAVLGVLLIAIGVGMPLDLTKISIGVIGGLGVLLLVLALLPRRKDEAA